MNWHDIASVGDQQCNLPERIKETVGLEALKDEIGTDSTINETTAEKEFSERMVFSSGFYVVFIRTFLILINCIIFLMY